MAGIISLFRIGCQPTRFRPNPRLSGSRGQMRLESTVNVYSAITYRRGYLTPVPLVSPYVYGTDTDVSACLATICSTSSAADED